MARRTLDELVYRIIGERRKQADPGNDLLGMLMRVVGEGEDDRMNDRQLRDELLTLVLAGHEIDGLANGQIAEANKCAPSQVTRDLANLTHLGWAEQIPGTGRWRLGPEIVQISTRHLAALNKARTRLDEAANRYSRT